MPSTSTQRRVRELCEFIRDSGGSVTEVIYNKHIKVRFVNAANEKHMIVVAQSPSDHRARLNAGARLARMLRVA